MSELTVCPVLTELPFSPETVLWEPISLPRLFYLSLLEYTVSLSSVLSELKFFWGANCLWRQRVYFSHKPWQWGTQPFARTRWGSTQLLPGLTFLSDPAGVVHNFCQTHLVVPISFASPSCKFHFDAILKYLTELAVASWTCMCDLYMFGSIPVTYYIWGFTLVFWKIAYCRSSLVLICFY